MNENKFEFDHVDYIAIEVSSETDCEGCALDRNARGCLGALPCSPREREDKRNVIFIKEV